MQTKIQEDKYQYSSVKHHPVDFGFKVFISSEYAWFPFKLVIKRIKKGILKINPQAAFYEISAYGLHKVGIDGSGVELPGISKRIIGVVFNKYFWRNIFPLCSRVFLLSTRYRESNQLAEIKISNVKIGDILAAEYLRDPKYGNGEIKFNLRFYKVVFKYLIVYAAFVRDLNRIVRIYPKEEIGFAIQEMSFKDEMRRRILIDRGICFEYHYNKFLGKVSLVEYSRFAEGRVLDYTPRVGDLTEEEIESAYSAMNRRLNDGVQAWTFNISDIDTKAIFSIPENFDINIPIAIVFLHAVADDQYRCGLDEFNSLDGFHRYTIDTLLELGYQCILKSHPGVNSPIHPDKTSIDRRYLEKLYSDYGLDYNELLNSDITRCIYSTKNNRLVGLHPKLSIQAIASKMKFLTITHHGNILFESKHLGLPTVKYRYCKSRAYHFCHDWATISEYRDLLVYYKNNGTLPEMQFEDSYLDVAAVLSRKTTNIDYNKELMLAAQSADIPVTPKPSSPEVLYKNFNLIQERVKSDPAFAANLDERFNRFFELSDSK